MEKYEEHYIILKSENWSCKTALHLKKCITKISRKCYESFSEVEVLTLILVFMLRSISFYGHTLYLLHFRK